MRESEVTSAEYAQLAEILPDDFSNPADTVEEVRAKFAVVHGSDPGGGVVVDEGPDGVWVRPDGDTSGEERPVVFFVHGGGFVTSSAGSYAFYAANLVRECGVDVFVAEYPLAPETTFPGQIDDLLAAYRRLIAGHDPAKFVFMGDSCGGGMALSTLVAARDEGLALPAAFVGLCGWFDMEATGESAVNPVGRDPFLNPEWLRLRAWNYVGTDGDPGAPGVSPLHAELSGLPPVLLQAGGVDRCRSDAERLAEAISAAGCDAICTIAPGMPHGFQGLAGIVPEADAALVEIAEFIAVQVSTSC